MTSQRHIGHATDSSTLADILERVLDKGIVIVGDIKVKIVDIELLTVQIRLLVCSVDKAKEIGLDWWAANPAFASAQQRELSSTVAALEAKVARMEAAAIPAAMAPPAAE